MENLLQLLTVLISFAILAIAAEQIGRLFARFRLPLISGFLFAGMLVGPFLLDLISAESIASLKFVDEISLAFIAFAAGSELYLKELKSRLRSIAWVTVGNAIAIPVLGSMTIFLLSPYIPFTREMATAGRLAVAGLAGAILMARSPSSAIAIINEMRARGPFTRTVVGVTMVADVAVIVLFAINVELADALLTSVAFSLGFVLLLVAELVVSLVVGYGVGLLLRLVLAWRTTHLVKAGLFLLIGYGVFVLSAAVRHFSHANLPFEFLMEPLLIAMIGSFFVTNFSRHRLEYLSILAEMAPPVYIVFFTLTGAALALDVLADTLLIALALFLVRLLGIFSGSFVGGALAGDPPQHNRLSWMAYVTQAGVGLGLAKEVAVIFPGWGDQFATVIIAIIVLNQIVGPPFFKLAVHRVGEAHERAEPGAFDGVRDALIFGLEGQALALARLLRTHDWEVRVACLAEDPLSQQGRANGVAIRTVADFDLPALQQLGMEQVDAAVLMRSDEVNFRLCELIYEHYGTSTVVVRLNDRSHFQRFHRLGALIIEPSTAIVSLLEQFVRSPSAASMILGQDDGQELVDIEVRNADLQGVSLRELRLPPDTLVLSIHREGHTIISHGYTQLEIGDKVTLVGSHQSLEEVGLRFQA